MQVAGFAGYIHGDFLKYTSKDLTGTDGTGGVVGERPGNGAMTPQGRKVVNYAQKYLVTRMSGPPMGPTRSIAPVSPTG